MKRYRLIYRGIRDAYYCFDTLTKKRENLGINDAGEAQRLIEARNEAVRHVEMNLQIAQVYSQHSYPTPASRTWQNVMEAMSPPKTGPTQALWKSAMKDKAFDLIRSRKLIWAPLQETYYAQKLFPESVPLSRPPSISTVVRMPRKSYRMARRWPRK